MWEGTTPTSDMHRRSQRRESKPAESILGAVGAGVGCFVVRAPRARGSSCQIPRRKQARTHRGPGASSVGETADRRDTLVVTGDPWPLGRRPADVSVFDGWGAHPTALNDLEGLPCDDHIVCREPDTARQNPTVALDVAPAARYPIPDRELTPGDAETHSTPDEFDGRAGRHCKGRQVFTFAQAQGLLAEFQNTFDDGLHKEVVVAADEDPAPVRAIEATTFDQHARPFTERTVALVIPVGGGVIGRATSSSRSAHHQVWTGPPHRVSRPGPTG